jgi:hypothetical protein
MVWRPTGIASALGEAMQENCQFKPELHKETLSQTTLPSPPKKRKPKKDKYWGIT